MYYVFLHSKENFWQITLITLLVSRAEKNFARRKKAGTLNRKGPWRSFLSRGKRPIYKGGLLLQQFNSFLALANETLGLHQKKAAGRYQNVLWALECRCFFGLFPRLACMSVLFFRSTEWPQPFQTQAIGRFFPGLPILTFPGCVHKI